ncbi:hypothetical protein LBMAG42_41490 [Deltaproteobacteria bacterium]|nr:hypothetical protein LBMAG42_41490 [Deltaproteobacteria bacterium]
MPAFVAATLAFATAAFADEPAPPAVEPVAIPGPEWHIEATSQLMPENVTLDLRARAEGKHDGYVDVAVRVDPRANWLGHAGVGFDLFGGGKTVDLRLGLFLGGVGNVSQGALFGRPAVGGEVRFGLKFGRVYGHYRHLDGFAGPLEDRLTEDELRLGFCLTDNLRVHAQVIALNPGDKLVEGGAGLGVEAVF